MLVQSICVLCPCFCCSAAFGCFSTRCNYQVHNLADYLHCLFSSVNFVILFFFFFFFFFHFYFYLFSFSILLYLHCYKLSLGNYLFFFFPPPFCFAFYSYLHQESFSPEVISLYYVSSK